MTGDRFLTRLRRRARHERAAIGQAVAVGRAAAGYPAGVAMFAVGMAFATPGRWGAAWLRGAGIERLRLRPRRLAGDQLAVNPCDSGHGCVVAEYFVEPVACDLALMPFEPAAIIDCGAHIGVFTLLARRRFPSAPLIAYEPNPDNVRWLEDNLRLNGITGVDVVPAAVSTWNGRSPFYCAPDWSESGRLAPADDSPGSAGTSEVDVVDLAAVVPRLAATSLLLKLDIEGEEERLIPAILPVLPRQCAIFFETHRGTEGWDAVAGALTAARFSVRMLRRRDVWHDGFAIRD
jgi:FkbM family methyltransferase